MSTRRETEAKIAQSMQIIDKQMKEMTRDINAMVARINREENKKMGVLHLKAAFEEMKRVEHYDWNYERSLSPSRRCFASNKILLPGKMAYKGIFSVGKEIHDSPFDPTMVFPEEVWITKEEFTIRRLKGQI